MCGIIGCSTPNVINKQDVRLLFLLAEERGGHACGFTNLKDIYKDAISADVFVAGEHFNEETRSFIGHTRYATKGNRYSDDNAHPFNFEKVIGVHNGTIFNYEKLQKEENVTYDVDSQFLYYLIDKYGLKATLPRLEGKLALAYYEKEKNTERNDWVLTLYRFDRPLWYGFKGESLFYGSEKHYLQALGCGGIKELQENTIYRLKSGRIISAKQVKKKASPTKYVKPKDKKDDNIHYLPPHKREETKTTDTHTVSGLASKRERKFYAPVHAELCELETGSKQYFKLYWFDDDNFDVVNVEDDSLAGFYMYYNLAIKEGRDDLKSDHEDIYDEILQYQASIIDNMSIRAKLEEEANGSEVSESCATDRC